MKRPFLAFFFIIPLCLLSISGKCQTVEDFLERYNSDEVEKYIQPLSDAVGSSMNSGWYRSVYIRKKGFQLYFGIIAQAALIPDKKKTFNATTPDFFTPASTIIVPTILGKPESVIVPGDNGTTYAFPGGVGASMLPIGVPQLTIGSVMGTDVSMRFLAYDFSGDIGKMDLFGWGIRHNISQYFKGSPVDIAVGYYNTRFELSDDLESTHQLISLQGSYSFGILELYGGLGYELGTFDYTYFSATEDMDVTIELEPGNSTRFTFGANLNLGAFTFNIDYNLADQSALSAGIGVGFGKREIIEQP